MNGSKPETRAPAAASARGVLAFAATDVDEFETGDRSQRFEDRLDVRAHAEIGRIL